MLGMHQSDFLLQLALLWGAAKLAAELAERLGQPPVLGELLAGILLGGSLLGWVRPDEPTLARFAEIGALLLLFEVGLESDLHALLNVGSEALALAVAGVVLTLGLGMAAGLAFGLGAARALFLGTALSATSVGITARVFADLGMLKRKEARVVLGAAVADDVIGLLLLAIISGLFGAKALSTGAMAGRVGVALLFLVGSILIGQVAAGALLRLARRMRTRGVLVASAMIFCVVLAALAERSGLAPILGAFAAGLVLARTEHKLHLEGLLKPVADLFMPLFFLLLGVSANLTSLSPFTPSGRGTLLLVGVLALVVLAGKVGAGLLLPRRTGDRWLMGMGMIPRGEVALIVAAFGLSHGVLSTSLYSALIAVVLLTTLVTPPLLKARIGARPGSHSEEDPPGTNHKATKGRGDLSPRKGEKSESAKGMEHEDTKKAKDPMRDLSRLDAAVSGRTVSSLPFVQSSRLRVFVFNQFSRFRSFRAFAAKDFPPFKLSSQRRRSAGEAD
jgi:Kef-type K+ transport system membrane component KefB